MNMSSDGLDMTKYYEGLQLTAYKDPAGIWTIGYGHTGRDVQEGMKISEHVASELLMADMGDAEDFVNSSVTVPLNQGQFDALADFVYNVGSLNFQDSTLLKYLNAGDYAKAGGTWDKGVCVHSGEFQKWIYAGGKVLQGLVLRRDSESQLFCTGDW